MAGVHVILMEAAEETMEMYSENDDSFWRGVNLWENVLNDGWNARVLRL